VGSLNSLAEFSWRAGAALERFRTQPNEPPAAIQWDLRSVLPNRINTLAVVALESQIAAAASNFSVQQTVELPVNYGVAEYLEDIGFLDLLRRSGVDYGSWSRGHESRSQTISTFPAFDKTFELGPLLSAIDVDSQEIARIKEVYVEALARSLSAQFNTLHDILVRRLARFKDSSWNGPYGHRIDKVFCDFFNDATRFLLAQFLAEAAVNSVLHAGDNTAKNPAPFVGFQVSPRAATFAVVDSGKGLRRGILERKAANRLFACKGNDASAALSALFWRSFFPDPEGFKIGLFQCYKWFFEQLGRTPKLLPELHLFSGTAEYVISREIHLPLLALATSIGPEELWSLGEQQLLSRLSAADFQPEDGPLSATRTPILQRRRNPFLGTAIAFTVFWDRAT